MTLLYAFCEIENVIELDVFLIQVRRFLNVGK